MVTTGASNDIQRSTELARNMVTKWGLSERLGPLTYSEEEGEVFLGRSVTQHKNVSDETAHTIDAEIRSIIDRNYTRAENLLKENIDKLHAMSEALMKYETIDSDQINDIPASRRARRKTGTMTRRMVVALRLRPRRTARTQAMAVIRLVVLPGNTEG
jgi:cell division protease FtsH